jgi:hypothetical protein
MAVVKNVHFHLQKPRSLMYRILISNFLLNVDLICDLLPDEPGKPGTPEVVDWDKDHVDLKWAKPINDGGAPISGYVIEKREVGSPKWVKACEVRINCIQCVNKYVTVYSSCNMYRHLVG